MKITVLGCGALGQLWLSALYQQGHQPQGWRRTPSSHFISHLISLRGQVTSQRFPANQSEHLAQSHLLLVTLKAWQISAALTPLLAFIPTDCPILLLHNGMGVVEELATRPLQPLLQGVTTQAVRHVEGGVQHIAAGLTQIGALTADAERLSYLAPVLHQALPEVRWQPDIHSAAWHKLAVNCVINPLTALYRCHNGELVQYGTQITVLCGEIAQVMTAEGIAVTAVELQEHVLQVIRATAQNVSSMLHDIRTQQPSEIDYITGYLLKKAQLHGISVPENGRLYESIKQVVHRATR